MLYSPVMFPSAHPPRIAVIVPCYNEAVTIAAVVHGFRRSLPSAHIWVFDNNSSDGTAAAARAAGATVRSVVLQGKGHVVRRMFADVEADIYVMVDGDATYDADAAPALIQMLCEHGLDMVVGTRKHQDPAAYRAGHTWGNRMLTDCVAWLFGRACTDMLSGYRVFSRRFVKSFPALSAGFETETELTVHALGLRMPVAEMETRYSARPEGSFSKLNTFRDGWRILRTVGLLMRTERPLAFFGSTALVLLALALGIGAPLITTYLQTGQVPRFPTAVLSTGLVMLSTLSLVCGLVLDTVSRARRETKQLAYLAQPGPMGGHAAALVGA
jgi:glycosyltransferase involved in cell wall biosynthesis